MPTETQDRVYKLLQRLPHDGLVAAKQLFWTELNYDVANAPLSRRAWPDRTSDALHSEPLILAQHRSQFGSFDVIYACLSPEYEGRDFPLSLTAERLAITQLLNDHPYALFVFSDPEEEHWHLVNVRYDRETSRRRIFRRIAIGPYERLRTAAERVAMLDLAAMSPDLFGLSPIAIQQRHDEAFDVEAVTREFFGRFAGIFYRIRDEVKTLADLADDADDHTQMLLDRLLFLYFVQKKGWLAQDPDYLYNHFLDGHVHQPDSTSFYGQVIYPLFLALSDRQSNRDLTDTLGAVPFLNGGLFELSLTSSGRSAAQARLPVTNATFRALFTELLEHYNFTISEDSPLDQEVAIDPEMLGKIFESLVLEWEQDAEVDLRKATGSYYTPRPVVAFMCREALAEHLTGESAVSRERIVRLLELPPAAQLSDEERTWLRGTFSRDEAQSLKSLLLNIRACDPAVGSGAFLMGLLQAITWVVGLLDWRLQGDDILARRNYTFDLKKQVIEHCIYGVDIQAQAVQICELRLWLSLIVDYELPEDLLFDRAVRQVPALPNLAYKVRQGDSLLERLFGEVVALDEMGRDRRTQEIVEDLQKEKAAYFSLADTPEKRGRELRILELQTALAGNLVEVKRGQALGYQPGLFGEETTAERRQRESWEERDRQYQQLKERVEQVRRRLRELRRDGGGRGVSIDDLRRQLLGDAEHATFLWRVDFAEVFLEKGGFDLMIANPPYGVNVASLVSNYSSSDSYSIFFERAVSLMKLKTGVVCFIMPTSWETGEAFVSFREWLFNATRVSLIVNLPYNVFQAAYVDTCIALAANSQSQPETFQIAMIPKSVQLTSVLAITQSLQPCNFSVIASDPQHRVPLDVVLAQVLQAVSNAQPVPLNTVSRSKRGVEAYQYSILDRQTSPTTRVYFTGNVYRYLTVDGTDKFIDVGARTTQIWKGSRILLRRIVSRSNRLMADLAEKAFIVKKDLYVICPRTDLDIRVLLALLNSSLMSYLYLARSASATKDDFRQITLAGIRQLPISVPPENVQAQLSSLVDQIRKAAASQQEDLFNELDGEIDETIFDIYRISDVDRERIRSWLEQPG